ncbi:uncharacterized protein STEHIDRAFT_136335 [Stereum hirsutum FP-91666 SS1]|uniref:uncharacterized protein n=1 Tax=Stereum hirsutum (strain FP-91666) TaxID=721885 RepID=UPI000440FC1C|nr:uncharacterized protein STEHIDRAFT_136335 [Stereum hirsutum FP-91666 SS1]EIM92447.1 hypothetical protein STEHIDRAFT_136335 [Stereum hirsutum FP-91666 SS1]
MIAGVSKAVTLYLSPILALTSLFLIMFAYLAPTVLLHDRVALLVVSPSTTLTTNSTSSSNIDGPTVFLGALGSCSRTSNDGDVSCTIPTLSPEYDLSALPSGAPDMLTAPTSTTPAFIAVSIGFSIIFFVLFTMTSLRGSLGAKMSAALDKPMIQRTTAWIGLLGFMIGLTAFLVLRMWMGKAVEDFNKDITEGNSSAELIADTSNGFTMIWVGYSFHAVPLICALAKLHVTASAGK